MIEHSEDVGRTPTRRVGDDSCNHAVAVWAHGGGPLRDRAGAIPMTATLLALISIVLWLGAILAAVEIPALTGLG